MPIRRALPIVGAFALVHAPLQLAAQTREGLQGTLPQVTVSVTRSERAPLDTPASIDVVGREALADNLRINLSESLARVPGLVVQNRQNYAQDLQISSRGFGARSTFGVRGLRLYADGIPATMPDGQGQVSHFDLASAQRIEVLRGPFSALYGNSSGGVIAIVTEEGGPGHAGEIALAAGSDAARRASFKVSGASGRLDWVFSGSGFETDGDRDHSAAERRTFNSRVRYASGEGSRVTWVLNHVDMPRAQDPLGLTRAEYEADRRQASPAALLFNTRKTVQQTQTGIVLEHAIGPGDSLRALAYGGTRETRQFQAIPVATQAPPNHPGGVIDLDRTYGGLDARWVHGGRLAGTPATLTAGLAYDRMEEDRRGFQNFSGAVLGVQGALRRDERNTVRNFDQYLQAEWEAGERWTLLAGVRRSSVRFASDDRYLANGDDSGAARYGAWTPVAGWMFHASERVKLYGTLGRGFETPTFNELAYQSGGGTGLNFGLRPARSRQWELGSKLRLGSDWQVNVAWFEATTRNEIVVLSNTGGRTTYQNAGRTARKGIELAAGGALGAGFAMQLAYTRLSARYADGFLTCTAAPCPVPVVPVAAGNRLPGIPRNSAYAELVWKHGPWGFEAGLEARATGRVFVNDINSDAAAGYAVANLRLAWQQRSGAWEWREFIRIDNLADRAYTGSVIVNEGNQRFFEPAPGRTWLAGVTARLRFD